MDFRKALLVSTAATMAVCMAASASAASSYRVPAQVSMVSVDAEQARLRAVDFQMAPIKSEADLGTYLKTAGEGSPLMALSPGARRRFMQGLMFNENGLVGYGYEPLARELSASQAYRILALFGAQRTTPLVHARVESDADRVVATSSLLARMRDDHAEFRCLGKHNCFDTPLFICMTGC